MALIAANDDPHAWALVALDHLAAALIARGLSQEAVAIEIIGFGMALLTRATSPLEAAMVLEEFAQRRQAAALGTTVHGSEGGPLAH